MSEILMIMSIACTVAGVGFGVAVGFFVWKTHEMKTYNAAEIKITEATAKILQMHNTLVQQMADVTDKVNRHEFMLKGGGNGISRGKGSTAGFKR